MHVKIRQNNKGMAIIVVLATLMIAALIGAHLTIISKVSLREATINVTRLKMKYAAESAADYCYWQLLADQAKYTNRELGKLDETREDDTQPWMMDGRNHEIMWDDLELDIKLHDASRGFDLSDSKGLKEFLKNFDSADEESDPEQQENIDAFTDIFEDYIDANDMLRLHGKENIEYEDEGYLTLPRNGEPEMREEIYWLDFLQEAVSSAGTGSSIDNRTIRIIPPKGFRFSRRSTKPNFFSCTTQTIMILLAKEDQDLINSVLEARNEWVNNGTPLDDTLDAEARAVLNKYFSFRESQAVTIEIVAKAYDSQIKRTIRITRGTNSGLAYADSKRNFFAYWEKVFL